MKFKTFMEDLEREGRDEYVGRYSTSGGKTFEIWLRRTGANSASVSYLRNNKKGTGTFAEVLPQFREDLAKLGLTDITYSTALDDKTQGKSRDRLFARYSQITSIPR